MPATPPVGFVTIYSTNPSVTVVARLGEDRPDVASGYGGWEEVERPRRTTVTTWKGQPARRLALAILLDGFASDTSVEGDIRRLERLALPRSGGTPPTVRIRARGSAIPYQNRAWVIDALTWGDAIANALGNRTRQAAALSLLEFVSDDLIDARTRKSSAQRERARFMADRQRNRAAEKAAEANRKAVARSRRSTRRKASGRAARATVTAVYDGEDLMAIAARELGDARRWREIADMNDIRDPRAMRVGQVIRLP